MHRTFLALVATCAAACAQTAPGVARPEAALLERNFHPNGTNPYEFPAASLAVAQTTSAAGSVEVTLQDGQRLTLSITGQPVLDILRDGLEPTPADSSTFIDAFAVYALVPASPENVNRAIREIERYVEFFKKDAKAYAHTYYTAARFLELSKYPEQAAALETSARTMVAALAATGRSVDTPESRLLELELLIGKGNLFVKSEAKPALRTTCYVLRDRPGGEVQMILNENALAWPDTTGGAVAQNVAWVLEPHAGSTLVRYVYAARLDKPAAKMVKKDRWEMAQKNVTEFVRGIGLLAVQLGKG